ncbi:alpha/beta-hydrolase [Basidiobolus meristosporus CBS 931.73]|uniref:Alpha/beta-hydrolase n=1 Tax=Basidiobolus meristosporus CBS 931.73 TaxID=1314790 RepID=A0A1Y1YN46_9FUNG|nr:alpha/beta-hydrolase [Basidiobolus meristosporus CBS 931.73]|eukprot:ORX99431.1 alpha/beta-hydrolase [Basidiobolus meristosporus CBS 931.73]
MSAEVRDYGSWESPISATLLASSSVAIYDVHVEPSTNTVFWVEGRPEEGGRAVLLLKRLEESLDENAVELTPHPFSPRTRVHEYGGGSFNVKENIVVFSNDLDFRLYKIDLNQPEKIIPVTPDDGSYRYADPTIHDSGKFLICVREEHKPLGEGREDVINTLVVVRLDLPEDVFNVTVLTQGHDFYSSPRVNPSDPTQLAYITWNLPFMPWDSTRLCTGVLAIDSDGEVTLSENKEIAGHNVLPESIGQPRFNSDGSLYFACDRTGFWNLYHYDKEQNIPELVLEKPMKAEFSVPEWLFNRSTFSILCSDATKIAAAYAVEGTFHIGIIDTKEKSLKELPTPFTIISNVRALRHPESNHDILIFTAGNPYHELSLVLYDVQAEKVIKTIIETGRVHIPESVISIPESITFPTENGQVAYGYYYPPKNDRFKGPDDQKPPLLTMSHSGPTSQTFSYFNLKILYWTSRGFAVVDVNYGGSTGYGREFRNRLKGSWGIIDVDDCCNAAKYLVDRGSVDPKRLSITGGFAGGYTTLCCLVFRPNVFKAGASYSGVSDLEMLVLGIHKFEAKYLDGLLGPYPEARAVYQKRSPLHHADQITSPCIFFQGLNDQIVPAKQAEIMVNALRNSKVPVAYVTFENDQHGLHVATNIIRSTEAQLWFFGKLFGFQPADKIKPVPVDNIDA